MGYWYEISIDITDDWIQSDLSTHIKYMQFLNFRGYCKTYFDSYDGRIQVYKKVEFPSTNNQIYHKSENNQINFYRNQLGLCRENEKATFYHARPLGYKGERWIENETPPCNGDVVLATDGKFIQKAVYFGEEWFPVKSLQDPFELNIHGESWRGVTHWQHLPALPPRKEKNDDER